MEQSGPRCARLVVLVYPAGPTRQEHLLSLQMLQAQFPGPDRELEVRLLPVSRVFGPDFETAVLPPTMFPPVTNDWPTFRDRMSMSGSVTSAPGTRKPRPSRRHSTRITHWTKAEVAPLSSERVLVNPGSK